MWNFENNFDRHLFNHVYDLTVHSLELTNVSLFDVALVLNKEEKCW